MVCSVWFVAALVLVASFVGAHPLGEEEAPRGILQNRAAALRNATARAAAARTTTRRSTTAAATAGITSSRSDTTSADAGASTVTRTATVTSMVTVTAAPVTVTAPPVTVTESGSTVTVGGVTVTKTVFVATTTESPLPLPTPVSPGAYNFTENVLDAAGITAFRGLNTGAVASWFRTDNPLDHTNGHSWCSFPYNDTLPGFAPSLDTMMANFDGSYNDAASAFCGLEAVFTTPQGRNATLYVIDSFADPYVLTPASIDVITGVFPLLYGSQTSNKNNVVTGVQWQFTGRRAEQFRFNGVGDGSG